MSSSSMHKGHKGHLKGTKGQGHLGLQVQLGDFYERLCGFFFLSLRGLPLSNIK